MSAKSTTSKIALTMFCAMGLSTLGATSAMAVEPELPAVTTPADVAPGSTTPSTDAPAMTETDAATEPDANDAPVPEAAAAVVSPDVEAAPTTTQSDAPVADAPQILGESPVLAPAPAPAPDAAPALAGVSSTEYVTAAGQQGWRTMARGSGQGFDDAWAFTTEFTPDGVTFTDSDANDGVNMGLLKTGADLDISDVAGAALDGTNAQLRFIVPGGPLSKPKVEIVVSSDNPDVVKVRIPGAHFDENLDRDLLDDPETLHAHPELEGTFSKVQVGFTNSRSGATSTTVRSVTVGGVTYNFFPAPAVPAPVEPTNVKVVSAVGDQGWRSEVGNEGSVRFTDTAVEFTDSDTTGGVDMHLSKVVNLTPKDVVDAAIEGDGATLAFEGVLSGPDRVPGYTSIVVHPDGSARLTWGPDDADQDVTLDQLSSYKGRIFQAHVGYTNSAQGAGSHTASIDSVTFDGVTYDFGAPQGQAPEHTPSDPADPAPGSKLVTDFGVEGWRSAITGDGSARFVPGAVEFTDMTGAPNMNLARVEVLDVDQIADAAVTGSNAYLAFEVRGAKGGADGQSGYTNVVFSSEDDQVLLTWGSDKDEYLTHEQLQQRLADMGGKVYQVRVGHTDTGETGPVGARVETVTYGGTTYVFGSSAEAPVATTVRVTDFGVEGWRDATGNGEATFVDGAVEFVDQDGPVDMNLAKLLSPMDIQRLGDVSITGDNAYLKFEARGVSGPGTRNEYTSIVFSSDSDQVLLTWGGAADEYISMDEFRQRGLHGTVYQAYVGHTNTGAKALVEARVETATFAGTTYVFGARQSTPMIPLVPAKPPAAAQPPADVQPPAAAQPPAVVQPPAAAQPPAAVQPPAVVQPPAQQPESGKPESDAQVGGVESVTHSTVKAQASDELAHTGAEDTAILAALAIALMGTGISVVGLKRRHTA